MLLIGESQNTLSDNIKLDLGCPTLEAGSLRTQPGAGSGELSLFKAVARPADGLRAHDRKQKIVFADILLRPVVLKQRRGGARSISSSRFFYAASRGKSERFIVHTMA